MAQKAPSYQFEKDSSFSIANYNLAPPFSSFLPGIAGAWGVPMWAFYVNRGQGLCSFGLRDKDHSISEFLPANWAYQLVYTQGFRTLLKVRRGARDTYYEPFRMEQARDAGCTQNMRLTPHSVSFQEINRQMGLVVEVEYFTLPQEPFTALMRTVRIKNTSSANLDIQMIDGLPMLVPFGMSNMMLKTMRYLAQSFTTISGIEKRTPGFRMKVKSDDSALVEEVNRINFCFGYEEGGSQTLLAPIVEQKAVFGSSTDFGYPDAFVEAKNYAPPKEQVNENHIPSAFLFCKRSLKAGQERVFRSFYGNISDERRLAQFVQRARKKGYADRKSRENRQLVGRLTQSCATVSSHEAFNAYARQNVLDNILRGGSPVSVSNHGDPIVLSLYSRKHGDLERDYNWFVVEPTQLSQGEGNYRDVNQNRRHDVFFNPEVGADTVYTFFNLLQPDGYNPLVVEPKKLVCRASASLKKLLVHRTGKKHASDLYTLLTNEFAPGALMRHLSDNSVKLNCTPKVFIEDVLQHAKAVQDSRYSMGYWADHWTYNLDLLDSFRGIYPDEFGKLLFKRKDFFYQDTHAFVKPRTEKYVLVNGTPMQLDSVSEDATKERMIMDRTSMRHGVRTKHGQGEVYHTTLAQKLLTLALVKFASLDSHGLGVEMDAERPGWNDALNGLPGQFGSSTCETFELKRLLKLLQEALTMQPTAFEWVVPDEIYALFHGLRRVIREVGLGTSSKVTFTFWDRATEVKEDFRARVALGFSGQQRVLKQAEIEDFLQHASSKVDAGLRKAYDTKTGLYHTYFRYESTGHKKIASKDVHPNVEVKGFHKKTLPAYLEGQVHALRLEDDKEKARELVRAVKRSGLYDPQLKMYKVNDNLAKESQAIGRARTFARGWLENESIWLHMEYKYLLEILRAGLAKEFFEEFKHCGIPFLDPQSYGRSTTENSSFIVSSVHPNKDAIGRGYMARLSGATAEFIHIWIYMCCGERPFRIDRRGRLQAILAPCLPAWLFTKKKTTIELVDSKGKTYSRDIPAKSFSYMFMNKTLVTYTQKGVVKDTFGARSAKIQTLDLYYRDGKKVRIDGAIIPEKHAKSLRSGALAEIRAALQ